MLFGVEHPVAPFASSKWVNTVRTKPSRFIYLGLTAACDVMWGMGFGVLAKWMNYCSKKFTAHRFSIGWVASRVFRLIYQCTFWKTWKAIEIMFLSWRHLSSKHTSIKKKIKEMALIDDYHRKCHCAWVECQFFSCNIWTDLLLVSENDNDRVHNSYCM